jgi:PIN domain nuclease of toxin-antitoxin system
MQSAARLAPIHTSPAGMRTCIAKGKFATPEADPKLDGDRACPFCRSQLLNLLLDMHIALWALEDNPRPSKAARALILDPVATLYVSVVSLWKIAIKHALGRGPEAMPMPAADAHRFFEASGFVILPVTSTHLLTLGSLPRHHDDLFDRLLVATALSEPYRLLTHNARLAA